MDALQTILVGFVILFVIFCLYKCFKIYYNKRLNEPLLPVSTPPGKYKFVDLI